MMENRYERDHLNVNFKVIKNKRGTRIKKLVNFISIFILLDTHLKVYYQETNLGTK